MRAALQPIANPARASYQLAAAVLEPAPPVDFNLWAASHIEFGSESPFPGRYNPAAFPYFARILEVLGPEHPANVVAFRKSAQLGGSVLAQIFTAASLDVDPGPTLYVHPTTDNAIRWVRTKWRPMLRPIDARRNGTDEKPLMAAESTKSGDNSTLYQSTPDGRGWLIISGANSAASLSMISVSRQVQDDLSKWVNNEAGDPESQADSRSKAYLKLGAKIFKISTPLTEHNCRITAAFERSTQEHWHVPCPHCGHHHALVWENLSIPEDDPGAAQFVCPACSKDIPPSAKRAMIAAGAWVAHNPGAPTVGFHLWTAYSPLETWSNIGHAWIAARGDPEKQQTFFNDVLGLAYKSAGEAPPWEALRDRANSNGHPLGIVPPGALLLTLGVDCQGNRLEWHLVGWGRHRKRFVIDYGEIEGDISSDPARIVLDALRKRKWRDWQGRQRPIDQLAIDAGNWTEHVLSWARTHSRTEVMAIRGSRFENAVPLQHRITDELTFKGKKARTGIRLWWVGVSGLKGSLYEDLRKDDPQARGHVAFPTGLPDEYFRQLCAERRVAHRNRRGYTEFRWEKDPSTRAEVLDTMIYAEAAAIRVDWRRLGEQDWDRIEAEREPARPPGAPDHDDPGDLFQRAFEAPDPPRQAEPAPPPTQAAAAPPPRIRPATKPSWLRR